MDNWAIFAVQASVVLTTVAMPTDNPVTSLPTRQPAEVTISVQQNLSEVDISPNFSRSSNIHSSGRVTDRHSQKCALLPRNQEVAADLRKRLESDIKLVNFRLYLRNETLKLNAKATSHMYMADFWVRVTDEHGAGLLLLRPEYEDLSLMTLSFGVEEMHVHLVDSPANCSHDIPDDDLEVLIRQLLLNDFNSSTQPNENDTVRDGISDEICNMHVRNISGAAHFEYYCCHITKGNRIKCDYLVRNSWFSSLFIFKRVLQIVIFLMCPLFIPGAWYRLKMISLPFKHKLAESDKIRMKTTLTTNPSRYNNQHCKRIRLRHLRNMKEFSDTVRQLPLDTPKELTVDKLTLKVRRGSLLAKDHAPVGVGTLLKNVFFRCTVAENRFVKDCCAASFLSGSKGTGCSWLRVLKTVGRSVTAVVVATPWLIRLYVYFAIEEEEMSRRKQEARDRNLDITWPGNLVLHFTPLHIIFIIMYIVLVIESLVYGYVSKSVKETLGFILRKCFQNMREQNVPERLGWIVRLWLRPCERYGCPGFFLGLLIWIITLPLSLCALAFYLLPTVNITLRLLARLGLFVFHNKKFYKVLAPLSTFEESVRGKDSIKTFSQSLAVSKANAQLLESKQNRLLQFVVAAMCLIFMYSVIVLFMELTAFFGDIIIYTLTGLILNSSSTLTYVSFLFLLVLYINDSVKSVQKRFLSFNKTLHTVMMDRCQDLIESVIRGTDGLRTDVALKVQSKFAKETHGELESKQGELHWRAKSLLLFIGRKDISMIPERFFNKACEIKYYNAPGCLVLNYLKVTLELGVIIIFLTFVWIVVMAFGYTYHLSSSSQVLAALAGGFVPFILRNFVFKSQEVKEINTDCKFFQAIMNEIMDDFDESWPINDIHCVQDSASAGSENVARSVNGATTTSGDVMRDADTSNNALNRDVTLNGTQDGRCPRNGDALCNSSVAHNGQVTQNGHGTSCATDLTAAGLLIIATDRELPVDRSADSPASENNGTSLPPEAQQLMEEV